MDITDQITPFSWIEHDDESASVTLYTSHKYKKELFKTRKKEGFDGSGYDWESLAQVFIQEKAPDLQHVIKFDPEQLMFCAYSSDVVALKRFAIMFKNVCENEELVKDIFSRTSPQKPMTKKELEAFMAKVFNMNTDQ